MFNVQLAAAMAISLIIVAKNCCYCNFIMARLPYFFSSLLVLNMDKNSARFFGQKMRTFLAGIVFVTAGIVHAQDIGVGYKDIFLGSDLKKFTKDKNFQCRRVISTWFLDHKPPNNEIEALKREVADRNAVWGADEECYIKRAPTIAGLHVHLAELRFYGEKLKLISLLVNLDDPENVSNSDKNFSYAALAEILSGKYGTSELVGSYESSKTSKITKTRWTADDAFIFVEKDDPATYLKVIFASKDYQREAEIRVKMAQKAQQRLNIKMDEWKQSETQRRKSDF